MWTSLILVGAKDSRPTKEKHVTIGVFDLKATKTIVVILEITMERNPATTKLVKKGIRVGRVYISVPPRPFVPRGVGLRRDIGRHFLQHDGNAVASDDAENWIGVGRLKSQFEAQLVAVKGHRGRKVTHDEER